MFYALKIRLTQFSKTFCLMVVAVAVISTSLFGQDFVWTQRNAPSNQWQFVTSSSDGTKLMAAANFPTAIYTSTNSGFTWTKSGAPVVIQWYCGASSADGTKLVAADNIGDGIYTSTNSGLTWALNTATTNKYWQSVASSSDGTKLVAAADGVYTSTNSGVTWTKTIAPVLTDNGINSVASSSDGSNLVALDLFGQAINISTNSGLTWTNSNAPAEAWRCVASSSDGTKLVAGAGNGGSNGFGIFTSTNSGFTWAQATVPSEPKTIWFCVVSSSDGTKLAALTLTTGIAGIYTSTNSGLTWIPSSVPSNTGLWSIASSSDGTKLVAVSQYGQIYTAYIPTNPPSITQQPLDLASCPDSSPVLGVTVAGTPPFGYQWQKDGTNLVDGGNVIGSTSNNLVLLDVSQSDSANYDIVVTNIVGCVTSSVATLFVTTTPAQATPVIYNGFIVGAILTDGGCGYTNQAAVFFSGQGGSGAAGYVQISDGSATNIVITSAGFGYPSNTVVQIPQFIPTVSIALTNTPVAVATPIIINGFIVGANLTASGSDYTTAPPVTFSDVSGSGATAYAQIYNGSVTNIFITSAGFGYSSNTVINIPPAAYLNAVIPSADSLMLGQPYQLQIANDLNYWTSFGSIFFATNNAWTSTDFWNVAKTNRVFFRLQMLP